MTDSGAVVHRAFGGFRAWNLPDEHWSPNIIFYDRKVQKWLDNRGKCNDEYSDVWGNRQSFEGVSQPRWNGDGAS